MVLGRTFWEEMLLDGFLVMQVTLKYSVIISIHSIFPLSISLFLSILE